MSFQAYCSYPPFLALPASYSKIRVREKGYIHCVGRICSNILYIYLYILYVLYIQYLDNYTLTSREVVQLEIRRDTEDRGIHSHGVIAEIWVDQQNIKPGDPVSMVVLPDGTISSTPRPTASGRPRRRLIWLDQERERRAPDPQAHRRLPGRLQYHRGPLQGAHGPRYQARGQGLRPTWSSGPRSSRRRRTPSSCTTSPTRWSCRRRSACAACTSSSTPCTVTPWMR